VDHVVLQEDLAHGERVRAYRIEGLRAGNWTELGAGSAIGHRRVYPVDPVTVEALRLTCTGTAGVPHIRRFAAFDTGAAPPVTWRDNASLWADDDAGRWVGDTFELEVTGRIRAPAQYRVRMAGTDGVARLRALEAVIGGVAQPQAIRLDRRRSDVAVLTVHGLGQRIVLRGRVSGATHGALLLRRIG
jgi:alpha-L-fucosidase